MSCPRIWLKGWTLLQPILDEFSFGPPLEATVLPSQELYNGLFHLLQRFTRSETVSFGQNRHSLLPLVMGLAHPKTKLQLRSRKVAPMAAYSQGSLREMLFVPVLPGVVVRNALSRPCGSSKSNMSCRYVSLL